MLKFYLKTKYCTVMYIPVISDGLFVIMGFNPDYQNLLFLSQCQPCQTPFFYILFRVLGAAILESQSLSCAKGEAKPTGQ